MIQPVIDEKVKINNIQPICFAEIIQNQIHHEENGYFSMINKKSKNNEGVVIQNPKDKTHNIVT